ncbi:MAG: tetratricopeptide repeat protein, partial [Planctomycetia bacterium]
GALAAINDAVRKNPDSLPLRRMLALSLLELGQFGTAREQLVFLREQAAAATPESLAASDIDPDEITLLEARTCLATDMISDAASLAATLTGFDAAGRVFDAAWKPGRLVTEASVLLATILAEKREDPQAAERVLTKLTETAPDDHRAWLALARWHARHGEPRRAADEIARATTLAPDSRDVLAAGFATALADGSFDAAARQAGRMRELFPELPDGGLCLAEVAVRRGVPEEALEPLQTALERLPDNPTLLLSLANAQLLTNRLDDAEQTIRGLVERATRPSPTVGMLEARLLLARRQWLAALKKLEAIRPLVTESGDAKRQIDLLLAECHANLGQADEQLAASRRVLGGDSGSLTARITGAAALAASDRPEQALAEYESIASELGTDRFVQQRQVWQPLLRLRWIHQLRQPVQKRDWSQVVALLDSLERSGAVPDAEMAVLRYDFLLAAEDPTAPLFLTRALEAHADEPQLWERLVVATGRQEGLAAALRRLESVPAGLVDDPRLLMLRARLAMRAPEQEADAILAGVEAKAASLPAEQSGRLLAAVAAVRSARGDHEGAERVWQAVLASNPEDLPTHFALFEQAYERRDSAKAGAAAEAISRLCGADTANGRAVRAATLLLEAARAGSRSAALQDGRPAPLAAEDAARLEAARKMLVEAENDRPGWPLLQWLGADLELLRGDAPAAIARLEKAVALSPEDLRFIRPLVTLLAGSGRYDRACEVLRKIVDATGDSIASDDLLAWARRALAEAVARSGGYRDVQEALTGLARNEDRDGKPAMQDMMLGIVILAGRPEPAAWRQAINGFAALAERRPLTDAERMQRAELLERVGRWDECRTEVIELAARPDLPPVVLATAAEMLIRHGDLEQAAAGLKTLADREPAGAGVIVLEARLALARGDKNAAVAAVRRLAAVEPASTDGPRRLVVAATLLEECGEIDEADMLFIRLADQSAAGVLARVDFLARRGRTAEALDMLQANRQRLGTGRFMKSAVAVVRTVDGEAAADQV